MEKDYGSDEGVEILNILTKEGINGYLIALQQSVSEPFKVSEIRVMGKTFEDKYRSAILFYKNVNVNGFSHEIPIYFNQYIDFEQQQKDILVIDLINRPLSVNGKTYFEFNLLANTVLVFQFFPEKIINCNYFTIKRNLKTVDGGRVKNIKKPMKWASLTEKDVTII